MFYRLREIQLEAGNTLSFYSKPGSEQENVQEHSEQIEGDCEIDIESQQVESSPASHEVNINGLESQLNEIRENVLLILKHVNELQSEVRVIKKTMTDTHKVSSSEKMTAGAEEFVKIYAGEKLKTSVNLNKEILGRVKDYVAKMYGITENESQIINTALLLALYGGR